MNREYEIFLTNTNGIDGQLSHLPATDLLDASIRHYIRKNGAARVSGALYSRADMLSVRGIIEDETTEQAPKINGDELNRKLEDLTAEISTRLKNTDTKTNRAMLKKCIPYILGSFIAGYITCSIVLVNL